MSFASVFIGFCFRQSSDQTTRFRVGFRAGLTAICGATALALTAMPGVASAQAPGTLDTTFAPTSGLGSTIFTVTLESIDLVPKVFVGGDQFFENRITLDGVTDPAFKFPDFGSNGRVIYTSAEQIIPTAADQDKTLIGGLFGKTPSPIDGSLSPALNLRRLNSDGNFDTTFDIGKGFNDYVTSILPEADGTIYVGGQFDQFNKVDHKHLVRLHVDGSIDDTFSPGLSINDDVLNIADQIDPATGLANGQILVVGTFNRVDKTATAKIARINHDGTLDTTFNPIIDTRVLTVAVQPNGKIIIGGQFESVNGTPVLRLARLNRDGSLDPKFSAQVTVNPPASTFPTAVYVIKMLGDGRFYAGGNFFAANGVPREYFARFLENGDLDTTFDPGSAIINSVQCIAVQPDNKVVLGETVSRKVDNIFPASFIRLFGDPFVPPVIPPPVVQIIASKPLAKEMGASGNPKNGQFKLKRTGGDLSEPLTVFLTVAGTAVSGVDYEPLDVKPAGGNLFRVKFHRGERVLRIGVRPTGTPLAASPETVRLNLRPDTADSYTVNPDKDAATVTLSND